MIKLTSYAHAPDNIADVIAAVLENDAKTTTATGMANIIEYIKLQVECNELTICLLSSVRKRRQKLAFGFLWTT